MTKVIAILATMDTKGAEADFIRQEINRLGAEALLVDIGVIGEAGTTVDITKDEVARAGGSTIADILKQPTRQAASDIMVRGAGKMLLDRVIEKSIAAVVGLGGTQGTPNCAKIMQQLPYGFPKLSSRPLPQAIRRPSWTLRTSR